MVTTQSLDLYSKLCLFFGWININHSILSASIESEEENLFDAGFPEEPSSRRQ